jgi:hypothetical protein
VQQAIVILHLHPLVVAGGLVELLNSKILSDDRQARAEEEEKQEVFFHVCLVLFRAILRFLVSGFLGFWVSGFLKAISSRKKVPDQSLKTRKLDIQKPRTPAYISIIGST